MKPLSECTILVVDDNEANVDILVETLSGDYEVIVAMSGEEALETAFAEMPDMILLDIMMPGLDGYEVCRRMKASDKIRQVPIIFITAMTEVADETKGLEIGAIDYITKPISPSIVRARVKNHLELKLAKEDVEQANRMIMESISYARMIQNSLLPGPDFFSSHIPESMVLWIPRDTVGGDIYFADAFADGIVISLIDCTGHGIPGAFMSMIASSGLRRITGEGGQRDPAEILRRMNHFVKISLQQDTDQAQSDDGLEMALCYFNFNDKTLTFAGANMPLFVIQDNLVNTIKGDRHKIGYKKSDLNYAFTNHIVPVRTGMSFFMATDGYMDQLGGRNQRSFGKRRLAKLIQDQHGKPFEDQREALLEAFDRHKGQNETQDDVCVIGFNLNRYL